MQTDTEQKSTKERLECLRYIQSFLDEVGYANVFIEKDDVIAIADSRGMPMLFANKLKGAGVVANFKVDEENCGWEFELNKDWRGAVTFCGNLTSFYRTKNAQGVETMLCDNEIMVEMFEELLRKLKAHNEKIRENNKELPPEKQQEEAKFVVVGGTKEFLMFCEDDDMATLCGRNKESEVNDPAIVKRALKIKVRAVKALAEIQKYYFEQARDNHYNIQDSDYGDRNWEWKEQQKGDSEARDREAQEALNKYIVELENYIKDCDKLIGDIDNPKEWEKIHKDLGEIYQAYGDKKIEEWEKNYSGQLKVLKFRNSPLFSKIILNHRNKQFRVVNSMTLFLPTDKFSSKDTWDKAIEKYQYKYNQLSKQVGDNLNNNISNYGGVSEIYFRNNQNQFDPSFFQDNAIPTLWGFYALRRIQDFSNVDQYCVQCMFSPSDVRLYFINKNNYVIALQSCKKRYTEMPYTSYIRHSRVPAVQLNFIPNLSDLWSSYRGYHIYNRDNSLGDIVADDNQNDVENSSYISDAGKNDLRELYQALPQELHRETKEPSHDLLMQTDGNIMKPPLLSKMVNEEENSNVIIPLHDYRIIESARNRLHDTIDNDDLQDGLPLNQMFKKVMDKYYLLHAYFHPKRKIPKIFRGKKETKKLDGYNQQAQQVQQKQDTQKNKQRIRSNSVKLNSAPIIVKFNNHFDRQSEVCNLVCKKNSFEPLTAKGNGMGKPIDKFYNEQINDLSSWKHGTLNLTTLALSDNKKTTNLTKK